MNKKIIVSAMLAALAAYSVSAYAQDRHAQNEHGAQQQGQRGNNERHDNDRRDIHGHPDKGPQHAGNRGAGPRHDLHKGNRVPTAYRNKQHYVSDWRGRHLSAPPRGHQWVQVDGDYVLMAVATGLITQLILGN